MEKKRILNSRWTYILFLLIKLLSTCFEHHFSLFFSAKSKNVENQTICCFHLENFSHNFVGNKVKERISKRMFQESKARQNFWKTNISYLLIRTRLCAYQEVKNVCFSEILVCFAFLKHPFWDSPFCLIPNDFLKFQEGEFVQLI